MDRFEVQYPTTTDCFAAERQINVLKNDIAHYWSVHNAGEASKRETVLRQKEETFFLMGCNAKIAQKRMDDTTKVLDKYSEIAKERIEKDSYSTRNVYIGIAVVTLVFAAFLIVKDNG